MSPEKAAEPIALVLAGGGARGAYEVGALSVILPVLEERGERVSIIVGTSVGALNATWLAGQAHRADISEVMREASALWRGIRFRNVARSLITVRGTLNLLRYLAGAVFLGRGRLAALLDNSPLEDTVEGLLQSGRLEENVRDGHVTAAVVATWSETGQSVVFVATRGKVPGDDRRRGIRYIRRGGLTGAHVRASAAIPVAFPPVELEDPDVRGWYVDGGTRMNTPIKPAIRLGAYRVIVIGLNGTEFDQPAPDPAGSPPDALDGAAQVAQGLLADSVAADVHTLAATNELLKSGCTDPEGQKRVVPYIFVAPGPRDVIGELAREVYLKHYRSIRGLLRDCNLWLLGRLLDVGGSPLHGELYSYLGFSPELAERLIARGRQDAEEWLAALHDDHPWQIGKLPG